MHTIWHYVIQDNSSLVLLECIRSINRSDFTWCLQYLHSTSFNVFVRVYLMPLIARLEAMIMEPSIDVETAGRTHTSRPTSFCPLRNFLSALSVNTLLINSKWMWNHLHIQIKSSPNTYWIIRMKHTFAHIHLTWWYLQEWPKYRHCQSTFISTTYCFLDLLIKFQTLEN